mmetsp:Transcript_10516/g.34003  ORF Transcript_10516/g.34003 Transcript_10516/m.34003 type:complete len:427 (-) Transcript_10516:1817-3097(-)
MSCPPFRRRGGAERGWTVSRWVLLVHLGCLLAADAPSPTRGEEAPSPKEAVGKPGAARAAARRAGARHAIPIYGLGRSQGGPVVARSLGEEDNMRWTVVWKNGMIEEAQRACNEAAAVGSGRFDGECSSFFRGKMVGFVGDFSKRDLDELLAAYGDDIYFAEKDSPVSLAPPADEPGSEGGWASQTAAGGSEGDRGSQTAAPWGLARVSRRARPAGLGDWSHGYSYGADGAGVQVYVVDTGVDASLSEFLAPYVYPQDLEAPHSEQGLWTPLPACGRPDSPPLPRSATARRGAPTSPTSPPTSSRSTRARPPPTARGTARTSPGPWAGAATESPRLQPSTACACSTARARGRCRILRWRSTGSWSLPSAPQWSPCPSAAATRRPSTRPWAPCMPRGSRWSLPQATTTRTPASGPPPPHPAPSPWAQ